MRIAAEIFLLAAVIYRVAARMDANAGLISKLAAVIPGHDVFIP